MRQTDGMTEVSSEALAPSHPVVQFVAMGGRYRIKA